MVDVIALASVVSSAGVAAATLISNAWVKRGDHRHERLLDFERRVWETKDAALMAIITKCSAIQTVCEMELDGYSSDPETIRKTRLLRVLDALRNAELTGVPAELLAYASDSVNRQVARLAVISVTEAESRTYLLDEWRQASLDVETAIDRQEFEVAAARRDYRKGLFHEITSRSALDVAEVGTLCVGIVDAARADLRGGVTSRLSRAD